MDNDNYKYAFVVSTGRCGTTLLGILLNMANNVLALNEGQIRGEDLQGEQCLKAMTLQNLQAYKNPSTAEAILKQARFEQIPLLLKKKQKTYYIEIAYYLAPFTAALWKVFPNSKLVFLYRDGRDFVQSVYTNQVPDPMPVGYINDRELTAVERFVAMGRLRPLERSVFFKQWSLMSPFQKNAWLWNETNRIILKQMKFWPKELVFSIKMERLLQPEALHNLLQFLEIDDIEYGVIKRLLKQKINKREGKILPHWGQWNNDLKDDFKRIGQDMLETLGYENDVNW